MGPVEKWWRRFLILPASLYWWTCAAMLLALALAAISPTLGRPPLDSLPAGKSALEICDRSYLAFPEVGGDGCCSDQLKARNEAQRERSDELAVACLRRTGLWRELLAGEPLARKALHEEEVEIERIYAGLRDLYGPPPEDESTELLVNVASTFAVGMIVLYLFGFHARRVTVPRAWSLKGLWAPLSWIAGATILVAVVVTLIESLEQQKTSFSWASYCIDRAAFYVHHGIQLPLAFLTAVQLSAGWHAMSAEHLPILDRQKPRWGVGPYVNFLETWCILIVVLTAATTALWAHQLVASPTRTNLLTGLLGFGALGSIVALVVRINRTALELRDRCEELKMQYDDAPDDPTGDLVGKSWWQVPTVFAASGGLAWWILESTGVSELLKSY